MEKKKQRYSKEVRARAVRMVLDNESHHNSRWAATKSVADKLGMTPETLRKWIHDFEDTTVVDGIEIPTAEHIRQLERENFELKRANSILKSASAFFAAEFDRQHNLR